MKLENQRVSLDLSQQLKKLGVEQTVEAGGCYWVEIRNEWRFMLLDSQEDGPETLPYEWCKAHSVEDLGEILWNVFEKNGWDLIYKSYGDVFNFKGTQRIGEIGIINLMRNPNMGAKMLIYLLENKLITL